MAARWWSSVFLVVAACAILVSYCAEPGVLSSLARLAALHALAMFVLCAPVDWRRAPYEVAT